MRILAIIFGIALVVLVAQDAFETIVLPRRVTRRIRSHPGLLPLATRAIILGGGPHRHPGHLRTDPDEH